MNDENAYYAIQGIAGHASLFSTVHDLQTLADLLLQKGHRKNKQMISENIINQFLIKNSYNNALGWAMDKEIFSSKGTIEQMFGHGNTSFTGSSIVIKLGSL